MIKLTETLVRLAGDGNLRHDGPLAVVVRRLVVAVVDVVGDARLGEALGEVLG